MKRRKCNRCGYNIVKAKKDNRVRYWISYYLPGGKQRTEICDRKNPSSIKLAEAAHGKRMAQKVESPSVLEKLPEATMTFEKLAE
jgi:hypothetical protein